MLAYMYTHPGKKLLFMGSEFGQFKEWDYEDELDWALLKFDMHKKTREFTKALNRFYKETPELWQIDYSWEGFEWIIPDDNCNSVLAYKRKSDKDELYVILNFTEVNREDYLLGADPGTYEVVFNTDIKEFGGTDFSTSGKVRTVKQPMHNHSTSLKLKLAGNSALFLKRIQKKQVKENKYAPKK